jgi:hypothetical protein
LADLQAGPVLALHSVSAQTLSDQLSQWLSWTDAIALSSALSGVSAPSSAPSAASPSHQAGASGAADVAMAAQVRKALTDTILADSAFVARKAANVSRTSVGPGGIVRNRPATTAPIADSTNASAAAVAAGAGDAGATNAPGSRTPPAFGSDAAVEETFFRQRCLALQQTMETRIGHLRDHLRQSLAARSADGARLAAVDAVLERALSQKERALLAGVSDTLGRHFSRLHAHAHAQGAAPDSPSDAPPEPTTLQPAPRAWIDGFRDTMRGIMLAELALRFEPIDGLAAALDAPHFSS